VATAATAFDDDWSSRGDGSGGSYEVGGETEAGDDAMAVLSVMFPDVTREVLTAMLEAFGWDVNATAEHMLSDGGGGGAPQHGQPSSVTGERGIDQEETVGDNSHSAEAAEAAEAAAWAEAEAGADAGARADAGAGEDDVFDWERWGDKARPEAEEGDVFDWERWGDQGRLGAEGEEGDGFDWERWGDQGRPSTLDTALASGQVDQSDGSGNGNGLSGGSGGRRGYRDGGSDPLSSRLFPNPKPLDPIPQILNLKP
jgi:hypothetical protein